MHRWSQLFLPTLREAPADAEAASHKLLMRAAYVRPLAAGIYSFLFLGQRTMHKVAAVIREEMDRIGQEVALPLLHPREIWEASGRWQKMGDNMFRLQDRTRRDLCLSMTAEEVVAEIARKELRSYKQLPQIWYQIQPKLRDEPRPKAGLLRLRQFLMKDSYSFDLDAAGLATSYRQHEEVYRRIFQRCGLKFVVVEAHSGAMGGRQSREFMVFTAAGEDMVAHCPACGHAANLEIATSKLGVVEDLPPSGDGQPEPVHTPGQKTIDDVARFLGMSPKNNIKTLAYMLQSDADVDPRTGAKQLRPLVVLMRGDHMLSEAKLSAAVSGRSYRPMEEEEIRSLFHSPPGYLGPLNIAWAADPGDNGKPWLMVEEALRGRRNLVGGANREEYHVRNLTPGENFQPTSWADLRLVTEGEGCPGCSAPLKIEKALEIGHIFQLGPRYCEGAGVRVLDENGREITPLMGSYGIGLERILAAAVEQNHDDNGFWLAPGIAPFDVLVTPLSTTDASLVNAALQIAADLEAAGFDVLLDDRNESPGVKFKDADLIGVPCRVTVGSKKFAEGKVEVTQRSTREKRDVALGEVTARVQAFLAAQ